MATRSRCRAGVSRTRSTDRAGTTGAGPDRVTRTMTTWPPRPMPGPSSAVTPCPSRPARRPRPSSTGCVAIRASVRALGDEPKVDLERGGARSTAALTRVTFRVVRRRPPAEHGPRLGRRGGRPVASAARAGRGLRAAAQLRQSPLPVPVRRPVAEWDAGVVRGSGLRQPRARRPASARRPLTGTRRAGAGSTAQVGLLDLGVHDQVGGRALRARSRRSGGCSRGRRCPAPSARSAPPAGPSCRSALMSLMMSKICSTRIGARPIDGSSSSSSFGRAIRARPIASICCSPPDSVPPFWRERAP